MAGGSKTIAVVGGGFVGLSSALSLQRAGHRVALLDRASAIACPAHSTSFGNAGTFAAYANVPVNKPGIVWDLPKMLTSPTSPLSIKPTPHLLKMIPWFAHFLRYADRGSSGASARPLHHLPVLLVAAAM